VASRSLRIPFGEGGLSAELTEAEHPAVLALVAHGAGAGLRSTFLDGVAEGFAAGGVSALRFNFPYTEAGRKAPDRPAVLISAWRAALDEGASIAGGVPLAASGKSLGGRMASMVAAEDGSAFAGRALVLFGYPLHAPGRSDQPRDAHLPSVTVPMLFIEGTNDSLANFDLMQSLVANLSPLARMHVVEGGDHSFRVRAARRPDEEIGRDLGGVAAAFLRGTVG
jgi:predicted alpha/beta-hydrolase family hydrolase